MFKHIACLTHRLGGTFSQKALYERRIRRERFLLCGNIDN
jgi:hypothetical protein